MAEDFNVTITCAAYKCLRCLWTWIPRDKKKPTVCPHCKSPYWDKERSRKKKDTTEKENKPPIA